MKNIIIQFVIWLPTALGCCFMILSKVNRARWRKDIITPHDALGIELDFMLICLYVLLFHMLFGIFLIIKKKWAELMWGIFSFILFFVLFFVGESVIMAF